MTRTSISWRAPEYKDEKKSADWYWAVGIVAVAGAAAAVFLGNVLFAILLVVGALSLMLFAARPPELLDVSIEENAIVIGSFRYPFATLESFWINEHFNPPKLLITSKRTFAPHIILAIHDVPADEIRSRLVEKLPEHEQHESLIQMLMEYLGF